MDFSAILTDYFSPIILIACLCVGYVIKGIWSNPKVNRFIPLIVMVLGLVLNIWFEGEVTLPIAVVGMVSGLASTGLYELVDTTILNVQKACKVPTVENTEEEEFTKTPAHAANPSDEDPGAGGVQE